MPRMKNFFITLEISAAYGCQRFCLTTEKLFYLLTQTEAHTRTRSLKGPFSCQDSLKVVQTFAKAVWIFRMCSAFCKGCSYSWRLFKLLQRFFNFCKGCEAWENQPRGFTLQCWSSLQVSLDSDITFSHFWSSHYELYSHCELYSHYELYSHCELYSHYELYSHCELYSHHELYSHQKLLQLQVLHQAKRQIEGWLQDALARRGCHRCKLFSFDNFENSLFSSRQSLFKYHGVRGVWSSLQRLVFEGQGFYRGEHWLSLPLHVSWIQVNSFLNHSVESKTINKYIFRERCKKKQGKKN